MRPLRLLFKKYGWIHLGVGLIGNISFVVGSAFFLYKDLKTAGTWLFIVGSSGMLIGTLGEAVVKLTQRHEPELSGRTVQDLKRASGRDPVGRDVRQKTR